MGTYSDLLQANKHSQSRKPEEGAVAGATPTRTEGSVVSPAQEAKPLKPKPETIPPRNRDTVIPRHHDTTIEMLETVRRAVKELGEKAATHRFTAAEKAAVAEIIYVYKQKGVKTSENEIARIAINHLVEDFRRNAEESVLAKVLKELNA